MRFIPTAVLAALLALQTCATLGAPAPADTPAEHHARGEVQFNGEWVPVDDLWETYGEVQAEMQKLAEKGKPVRYELDTTNREILKRRQDYREKVQPLHVKLRTARSQLYKAKRVLARRPPRKPRLREKPDRPSRGGYSDEESYDRAMDRWEERVREIEEANRRAEDQYEDAKKAYEEAQAEAKETLKTAGDEIDTIEAAIKEAETARDLAMEPLLEKRIKISDTLGSLRNQASLLIDRAKAIKSALAEAPQEVVWREGYVLWDGQIHAYEALKAYHEATQAEIDRLRHKLKSEAEAAGRTFPENWRHPQQDKLDELKSLLDRVAAARAGETS